MKSSNLAQRLEDYEADINSLCAARAARAPRALAREHAPLVKPTRRARRVGGIQLRDGGLRLFRVC